MKGIVAQIEGKYAVVLTQDGSFRKVRAKPYMETGVEIDMDRPSGKMQNARILMKVTSIAAAALLTLSVGYGAYSYAMPYSYVHLDINPSVELTANVYDRIIKAEALNEDGRKLLEDNSLKYARIETGISDLLGIAVEKGYLKESGTQSDNNEPGGLEGTDTAGGADAAGEEPGTAGLGEQPQDIDNAVLVTVSSNSSKKSGNLKKKIMDMASKELDTDKVDSEILVGEASIAQRNEARELGVTPGKLALIEDALESGPELQLDDLKKNSVKELLKKIQDKEKKKQENGKNGAKAGVEEQSSQGKPSDKNANNQVGPENTSVLGNQGNGKGSGIGDSKKNQGQPVKNGQAQTAQGTQDNNLSKNRLQNKSNNIYNENNGSMGKSLTGTPDKVQNEEQNKVSVNGRKQDNGKKPAANKSEQAKSVVGSSNNKKIDDADRKTAGKTVNELKTERKQLRNDLLDQMEKQLEEHSGKKK